MTNSYKLKNFLAMEMALIDSMHYDDKTYQEHYNGLMQWNDFDLLSYWIVYNGVFDGGESMLNNLKILVEGSITLNPKSVIENCNI